MITEKDARAGAARDMGFLAELDFQIRDNHKLTSEVMRLDDENAKLREESSKYHDLYVHAIADAEVWHLQWSAEHQENAKLRELCGEMLLYIAYPYVCVKPSVLVERAREMGIEVE